MFSTATSPSMLIPDLGILWAFCVIVIVVLTQGLTMGPWLACNTLCRSGWPQTVAVLLPLKS